MGKQFHLLIDKGDVAPYVLLPGDPKRVQLVASFWDEAHKVAENREYVTYTGKYKGMPISCTSTGIGCPSTSIAMEELARCGAKTFLRIGTCGTFQDNIKNGDIAIFDAALRLDGASKLYVPTEFPAVANYEVIAACVEACKTLDMAYHVGTTRTADTFYAGHAQPGSSYDDYWQSAWENQFQDMKRMGLVAAEMEASIVLTLAKLWGLRAGGIAVVLDNICQCAGDDGNFKPDEALETKPDFTKNLSLAGCEALYEIYKKDNEK